LEQCAAEVLSGNMPVIVDANFGRREQRRAMIELCRLLEVPLVAVQCEAPMPVLRERIEQRQRLGTDASEAGVEILDLQLAARDPIAAGEFTTAVVADTSRADVLQSTLAAIRTLPRR
jgi:hypothetical protein